eukprot:TRINITY_DN1031_c0_g1_i1.p1 TRINITY_DN1031_c0_g1~~TRINITY_DN1031_c0_g1_i1.p1  ORF type:complete len:919 (-),score=193.65 TRINITY_DN1031_c0_g1_i1:756-3512(-)
MDPRVGGAGGLGRGGRTVAQQQQQQQQRSLLYVAGAATVGFMFLMYLIIGRQLRSFDETALAIMERVDRQMGLQTSTIHTYMTDIMRNETRQVLEELDDASDLQLLHVKRMTNLLTNHTHIVSNAFEDQVALQKGQLRLIMNALRDTEHLQEGQQSPKSTVAQQQLMQTVLNQTAYAVATLRAQRRSEKALLEVLHILQEQADSSGTFQASVERTLRDVLSAMQKHTEIQQAAQETLDALSGLLASQTVQQGPGKGVVSTSSKEQDRIHDVLKALVAHLRNQEKESSSSLTQMEVTRTLDAILAAVRNKTDFRSIRQSLLLQTTSIERLHTRLSALEVKLPTLEDLAILRESETKTNAEGGVTAPDIQAAILGLLQESKKQTQRVSELQEKVLALDEDMRGEGGPGRVSLLVSLLKESHNQTDILGNVVGRLEGVQRSVRERCQAGGGGTSGDGVGMEAVSGEGTSQSGGDGGQASGESGGGSGSSSTGKEWLKSSEVTKHKVDFADAGAWQQHDLVGSPSFMRFSGHRLAARKLAAIGIGMRATVDTLNVKACRWVGREASLDGQVSVFLSGSTREMQSGVIVLQCVFDDDVPSNGGYLTASVNGQDDYVLYREEIGEFATLDPTGPFPSPLTMCVSPLWTTTEVRLLREFLEYHRLLGVEHFVFYDGGGISPEMWSHFAQEERQGLVELVPIHGIERQGQDGLGELLANHDCLHASTYTSQWVLYAEANEYLWTPFPDKLQNVLKAYSDDAWLTHGSIWWASSKCKEAPPPPEEGEDANRGDGFSIERMIFRWPYVLCHDPGQYPDRRFCLGNNGHRKLICDPRRVTLVEFNGPNPKEESRGTHLSTDLLAHLYYQRMLEFPQEMCAEVIPDEAPIVFWYRNYDAERFAQSLRSGRHCNFTAGGCIEASTGDRRRR